MEDQRGIWCVALIIILLANKAVTRRASMMRDDVFILMNKHCFKKAQKKNLLGLKMGRVAPCSLFQHRHVSRIDMKHAITGSYLEICPWVEK